MLRHSRIITCAPSGQHLQGSMKSYSTSTDLRSARAAFIFTQVGRSLPASVLSAPLPSPPPFTFSSLNPPVLSSALKCPLGFSRLPAGDPPSRQFDEEGKIRRRLHATLIRLSRFHFMLNKGEEDVRFICSSHRHSAVLDLYCTVLSVQIVPDNRYTCSH